LKGLLKILSFKENFMV